MADESTLSIQTERVEKAVIVSPLGRVDGSNAAVLESAIQEQLDAGEKVLAFDFQGPELHQQRRACGYS